MFQMGFGFAMTLDIVGRQPDLLFNPSPSPAGVFLALADNDRGRETSSCSFHQRSILDPRACKILTMVQSGVRVLLLFKCTTPWENSTFPERRLSLLKKQTDCGLNDVGVWWEEENLKPGQRSIPKVVFYCLRCLARAIREIYCSE